MSLCTSLLNYFCVFLFTHFTPFFLGTSAFAAFNSDISPVGMTPPMGWNSWNQFGCNINETLIKETADAIVQTGMKDAGYTYVVIDDCWQSTQRDKDGNLQADPIRFPRGIAHLADYVHHRGLKLGIYTSIGRVTCQGYPGSLDHEVQDAWKFAEWGVDFVKDDFCTHRIGKIGGIGFSFGTNLWDYQPHYFTLSAALQVAGNHYGSPILFSLCNWGMDRVWEWAAAIAPMARIYWDIKPQFSWIERIIDYQKDKDNHVGPGYWNDLDTLEVGVEPLTETESKAHFSMWSILASPLFAGNDVRNMSKAIQEILTAPEVIAINQDEAGHPAKLIQSKRGKQVWMKALANKRMFALALFNRKKQPQKFVLNWKDFGFPLTPIFVRDLWKQRDLGSFNDSFSVFVKGHDVVLLKVGF